MTLFLFIPLALILALSLVAALIRAQRFKLLHPLDNAFIIGPRLVLEVKKGSRFFRMPLRKCTLDDVHVKVNGQAVSVQWERNAYGNFSASITLAPGRRIQEIEYDSRFCGSGKRTVYVLEEDRYEPAYRLARYILASKHPHKLRYDWSEAVMLYGLSSFSLVDPEHADTYLDYMRQFFDKYDRKGYPRITTPDLCPIAITAVEMKRHYHVDLGRTSIEATREFLENEPRNPLGALDHIGYDHRFHPLLPKTRLLANIVGDANAVWVDSLVMYAVTMAKIAALEEDEDLFEFALNQPIIFAEVLQEANSLFKHAYFWKTDRAWPKDHLYWLRGNGWVMVSLVEILSMTPESHPKREQLIDILKRQVEAIVGFQDPVYGLWDTLIRNPDGRGYLETSGAALVAYAMAKAIQQGLIDEAYMDYVLRAYEGLSSRVYLDGDKVLFTGMSGATNAMRSGSRYLSFLVKENTTNKGYGVGAYLLLAKTLKEMEAFRLAAAPGAEP